MTDLSVTIDGPYLAIREQNGEAPPHRRVLAPGAVVAGTWRPTPLSAERKAVKDAAAETWTPAVVAAFRAQAEAEYAATNDDAPAVPASAPVSAEQLAAVLATLLDVPAEQVQAAIAQAESQAGA